MEDYCGQGHRTIRRKSGHVVCRQCERRRTAQKHRCASCGQPGGYWSPTGECWDCTHGGPSPWLRTPTTVRQLSTEEAAWIGGLFEGEGCVSDYGQCRYSLRLASTEVETIATLLRLVGQGCVVYHRPPSPRKESWQWSLAGMRAITALGEQILPYLTSKRAPMEALIERLSPLLAAG